MRVIVFNTSFHFSCIGRQCKRIPTCTPMQPRTRPFVHGNRGKQRTENDFVAAADRFAQQEVPNRFANELCGWALSWPLRMFYFSNALATTVYRLRLLRHQWRPWVTAANTSVTLPCLSVARAFLWPLRLFNFSLARSVSHPLCLSVACV